MKDLRILLVDDEEELVTTMVERLEFRGLQAVAVLNGDDALARMAHDRFDAAVIDLKMPGLGGLALRDLIRERFPDVVVLLATGHGHEGSGDDTAEAGDEEILLKPFDLDVLIDCIERRLDEREARS